MPVPVSFQQGLPITVFAAVPPFTPVTSDIYCVPGKSTQNQGAGSLTWHTKFATDPSAFNCVLEGSNDGTNWYIVDTTTVFTSGEARTVVPLPNFKQFRFRVVSGTIGTGLTLIASIGG